MYGLTPANQGRWYLSEYFEQNVLNWKKKWFCICTKDGVKTEIFRQIWNAESEIWNIFEIWNSEIWNFAEMPKPFLITSGQK